ncbi:NEW3 domain-containing protein [Streptomyces sp. M19]
MERRGHRRPRPELPTDRPLTADWTLKVPADAAYGYHEVTVAATYRAPPRSRREAAAHRAHRAGLRLAARRRLRQRPAVRRREQRVGAGRT